MANLEIPWTNKAGLTRGQIIKCKEVISILCDGLNIDDPWYHGSTLALLLKTTPVDIRKRIQTIREHNEEFLSPVTKGYIIANNKGYSISYDKKAIKTFIHKTHAVGQSKLQQVEQGYKALGMKGW